MDKEKKISANPVTDLTWSKPQDPITNEKNLILQIRNEVSSFKVVYTLQN